MSVILLLFLSLALLAISIMGGGQFLVWALPSYGMLAVAAILESCTYRNRKFPYKLPLCISAAILFFCFLAIRALCSPVNYLMRQDLFLAMAALIVYLLTATIFTLGRRRMIILLVLMAAALMQNVAGVYQFIGSNPFDSLPWMIPRDPEDARAAGLFISPNHYAGFLEIIGALLVSAVCWSRWRPWMKVLLGYVAITCLFGIAISMSRGGYISMIIALFALAAFSAWTYCRLFSHRFSLVSAAVMGMVAALVLAALFFMNQSGMLRQRIGDVYEPQNMRLLIWEAAIQQFRLAPVIGTGSGTFLYYGRQFRSPLDPSTQTDPIHAHNDYLELLAEYGVIGAACLLFFLVCHIQSGIQGIQRITDYLASVREITSNPLALNIGAMGGIAALLSHSVTDFNLHIPSNALMAAFLFGILANPGGVPPAANSSSSQEQRLNRCIQFSVLILGIVLLCLTLLSYRGEYFGEKARVALTNFDPETARNYVEKALQSEKKNPNLYYVLGESLSGLAESSAESTEREHLYLEALDAYEEGLTLFPRDETLLLCKAWALDALQRFDESEPVFRQARMLDPNSSTILFHYGVHLELQGHIQEAKEHYLKAKSLFSEAADLALRRLNETPNESPSGPMAAIDPKPKTVPPSEEETAQ